MRFEESDRVLAGWLSIATDQGEEGLDDVNRRQFRRFEKSMVVCGCVVAAFVLPSCRRLRLRGCLGRAGILHGDHGWIEPGGVLFEMRDLANNMKPCIAPEMALDKANVMDPVVKRMSDKVVTRCKVAAVPIPRLQCSSDHQRYASEDRHGLGLILIRHWGAFAGPWVVEKARFLVAGVHFDSDLTVWLEC